MSGKDKEREERLAAALRENLRRRKAQARELSGSAPAQAGAQFPSNKRVEKKN